MVSGFTVSMLWMMFFHTKESTVLKVSQLIFGKPAVVSGLINVVDPIIISLTTSILVTIIVAAATKHKFDEKHIETCFKGIGK
jgi:SSS family solute:Na+ symporter